MRAQSLRRSASLPQRANFFARVVIRFRIWRFIQRHVARRAPPWAFYATRDRLTHSQRRAFVTFTCSYTPRLTLKFRFGEARNETDC